MEPTSNSFLLTDLLPTASRDYFKGLDTFSLSSTGMDLNIRDAWLLAELSILAYRTEPDVTSIFSAARTVGWKHIALFDNAIGFRFGRFDQPISPEVVKGAITDHAPRFYADGLREALHR